jgi:hypothetical protein
VLARKSNSLFGRFMAKNAPADSAAAAGRRSAACGRSELMAKTDVLGTCGPPPPASPFVAVAPRGNNLPLVPQRRRRIDNRAEGVVPAVRHQIHAHEPAGQSQLLTKSREIGLGAP